MIIIFFRMIINIIFNKGGDIMMAMFFAQRVILGKTAFNEVPASLKEGVKQILVESGLEILIKE